MMQEEIMRAYCAIMNNAFRSELYSDKNQIKTIPNTNITIPNLVHGIVSKLPEYFSNTDLIMTHPVIIVWMAGEKVCVSANHFDLDFQLTLETIQDVRCMSRKSEQDFNDDTLLYRKIVDGLADSYQKIFTQAEKDNIILCPYIPLSITKEVNDFCPILKFKARLGRLDIKHLMLKKYGNSPINYKEAMSIVGKI